MLFSAFDGVGVGWATLEYVLSIFGLHNHLQPKHRGALQTPARSTGAAPDSWTEAETKVLPVSNECALSWPHHL